MPSLGYVGGTTFEAKSLLIFTIAACQSAGLRATIWFASTIPTDSYRLLFFFCRYKILFDEPFFGLRIAHVRFLISSLCELPKLSTEETTELYTWLKENAVHLNSVEADSGFDDMQPLKAIIGDARILPWAYK